MKIERTIVFLLIIYKTIRQINAACDPSCKTCSGPPPNNCITCTDTSKFLSAKMNNSCVASCAASEFADTIQQDAPENALKNKQTQKSQEIPEIEDFNEPYLTPSNQIKIDSNELDVKQNKGKNEIFFYQPKTSNILTYKYLSTNNQNSIYYKLFTLFDYKSTFSGLKI
ncbi:hypothetical protein ABPG74_010653 [Tetrahymena malaccensis]